MFLTYVFVEHVDVDELRHDNQLLSLQLFPFWLLNEDDIDKVNVIVQYQFFEAIVLIDSDPNVAIHHQTECGQ